MRRNTRLVTVGGPRLAVGLALVACASLIPGSPRMVTSGRALNLMSRVAKSVAALPLSFEPNQGQARSDVLFLARLKDSSLLLTRDGITLPLAAPRAASAQQSSVQMQFIGANPAPEVFGATRLSGTSNYFIGRDPSAWHTNIPTYGVVTYRQLYSGIDVTLRGIGGHLEYDFIVHPGADPQTIGLRFSGATGLQIGPSGELVLDTAEGQLRQSRPYLYQETGDSRHLVSGRFEIRGEDEVGFAVGSYDPGHPLIIDPVLAYSTYLGGSGYDAGVSVALDATGNIYV